MEGRRDLWAGLAGATMSTAGGLAGAVVIAAVDRVQLWMALPFVVITLFGFYVMFAAAAGWWPAVPWRSSRRGNAKAAQMANVSEPEPMFDASGWIVSVVRTRPRTPEGAWADARPEIRVRKVDENAPDERLRIYVVAPDDVWRIGRWSDPARMAQPTAYAHVAFPDDFEPKPVGPLPAGQYAARVVAEREDEQTGQVTKVLVAYTLFELTPEERFRAPSA